MKPKDSGKEKWYTIRRFRVFLDPVSIGVRSVRSEKTTLVPFPRGDRGVLESTLVKNL